MIKTTNEILIQINTIKNIESINFSDASIIKMSKDKPIITNELLENGKELIIPMLTVTYNGMNIITLCSQDEYFNTYVEKVKEVYLKEKDRIIPPFNKTIEIDDNSKNILLSGIINDNNNSYDFYKDKEGYDKPLILNDKKIKFLLPIIEYVIKENLKLFNKDFKIKNEIKGYSGTGNYVISGYTDGIYDFYPSNISINENTYEINIGNIIKNNVPLKIIIRFKDNKIELISIMNKLKYYYYESFNYEDNIIINTKELDIDNKCVLFNKEKINKNSEEVLSNIDEDNNNVEWYKLPWNANVGIINNIQEIDSNNRKIFNKLIYSYYDKDIFVNKILSSNRFIRDTNSYLENKNLKFDIIEKNIFGIKDNDLIIIETKFNDNGLTGTYKEKYQGKYFYHITNKNEFNEIDKNNLISINKDMDIYTDGDILENDNIKKYIKEN